MLEEVSQFEPVFKVLGLELLVSMFGEQLRHDFGELVAELDCFLSLSEVDDGLFLEVIFSDEDEQDIKPLMEVIEFKPTDNCHGYHSQRQLEDAQHNHLHEANSTDA